MLKVLICDDDVNITNKVQTLIDEIKNKYRCDFEITVRNSGEFVMGENSYYDIAIVDIEMPGISGLELSEKLKSANPDVLIIVLTSFSNYLDSAMKIQVFRYLSKPIDVERFNRNFLEAIEANKEISKQIIIQNSDSVYTVKTKDILYIENQKHGSVVVTKQRKFDTNKKPIEWDKIINQPNCFVFSHKSFLVNLQNVVNFNKHSATFQCGSDLVEIQCVSQRKYTDFKNKFFAFAGGIKWQLPATFLPIFLKL